jgi:hypothetical protein
MSVLRTLPTTLAATLACAVLTLNGAHANDGVTFRDVLKPGGKARSSAQKLADGDACGTTGPHHTIAFMPTFEKCMNAKGYVLDHYTSHETPAAGGKTDHYVDIKGDGHDHERGDGALQADTRACRAIAGKNINACLADRGWKYMLTKYGPPLPHRHAVASAPQSSWGWSWSSSGSSSSSNNDDSVRQIDESNQQQLLNSQTINQAIQSSNDMAAAAAVQQQVDQNLANMPPPPNN